MKSKEKKKEKKPEEKGGVQESILGILHDVVYILAAISVVFLFAIRLVSVNGDSMFSTLHHGDYMLLQDGLIASDYEYGDIIVATVPAFSTTESVVKRVIATGGQTVKIEYDAENIGHVFVDGKELTEHYINEPMNNSIISDYDREVEVPEGYVFVMGDNRNHSADSRAFGIVDTRYILGKVFMIGIPGDNSDGLHRGGAWDWSRVGFVRFDNE